MTVTALTIGRRPPDRPHVTAPDLASYDILLAKPDVVLSYGMGVDSTAVLLRWLNEPETRPCPLDRLLVITAMTGDEWPITGRLVTEHILPLLREHKIRYVQVARAGPRQADGVTVLDDSREPTRLYLEGDYALSAEMTAAGTVPQVGGIRKCSLKAKGWPLDQVIGRIVGGGPFVHVIGFESGEAKRAKADRKYGAPGRTPSYPLIEWQWDRGRCERYIFEMLGVPWPKSACTYCPFALCSSEGPERALDAYERDPAAGVNALVMEYVAVALNPRQGLTPKARLADILAATGRHAAVLELFDRGMESASWRVYEVRRATVPVQGKPDRGRTVRSVQAMAAGSRDEMRAELEGVAGSARVAVRDDDGLGRVWMRRRGGGLPDVEWFYVTAPEGAADKDGPGFERVWPVALAGAGQDALISVDEVA
jgi:hypothetical protein